MPIIKCLAAVLLAGLLVACEPIVTTDQPNTSPTPSPSVIGDPPVTSTPVPVSKVKVQIQIQTLIDKTIITGADVSVTGPSQPNIRQTSDASGRVSFSDLPQDGEYIINVQATGFEGATRKVNLGQLTTLGQKELLLAIELNTVKSTVTGRVVDANGAPLVGANVFDSRQNTSTDGQGRYTLGYSSSGELRLAISKTGYLSTSRQVSIFLDQKQDLGDTTLTRRTGKLQLGIDTTHLPLGQTSALSSFAGIQTTLINQGYGLQTISNNLEEKLAGLDVLVILCPSTSFSASEIAAIQAFVLGGGKLVVTGEWAGFAGFDGAGANQLLSTFNIQFALDSLRDNNSGFISIKSFDTHPITASLKELRLYQSGSVLIGQNGSGALIARTASSSFQIASNTGAFAVIATSTYGSGKVAVLGDTSLWSNEDSDANGTANINEADNNKLLQQILSW